MESSKLTKLPHRIEALFRSREGPDAAVSGPHIGTYSRGLRVFADEGELAEGSLLPDGEDSQYRSN